MIVVSSLSLAFFFSIIHHPPTSTLFPYTTLFRSARIGRQVAEADDQLDAGLAVGEPERKVPHPGTVGRDAVADRARQHQRADRKSTRLNSSHVAISYAVFCLKKKKVHQCEVDEVS